MAVRYYYHGTNRVAIYLDAMFAVSFPEIHDKYQEAFAAGRWIAEDHGPWLGRAIVYKLQVKPHRDGLDGGQLLFLMWAHMKVENSILQIWV
jgi:hypothetical protein